MKRIALFAALLSTACIDTPEVESTESSAINGAVLKGGADTEAWVANDPNNVDTIWPANIKHTQVLFRRGPDKFGYPAMLVFVIWGHTTVGHVYWLQVNSTNAVDFRQTLDQATYLRTNQSGIHDYWAGGNGGGGVGIPPTPHPGLSSMHVSQQWLDNALDAAQQIDNAEFNFNAYADADANAAP